MVTLYEKVDQDKTSALSIRLEKVLAVDEEAETCTTPTTKEHRIPEVVTCPPAPGKRNASFLSIKNVSKKKKSKKVDKLFVSSEFESMLGLHQVSCKKIPWRSKKKFQ
ncbi:hypothetical protein Patl1_00761 [Pistacia atlantica]|uniref:Uncharacterized protein n=1 Tax=Pistacia atlantica TaxID=434234 RepID=A0ACC1CCS0_9ROSI|nr:hypothetical protein Patl1_00761 [Pistacia atlantica]